MPRSSASPAPSGARRAHFVVDGSNIATEGRAMPSLQQLNEAVLAFMEEHPNVLITVVVDATFGHRIDKKEVKEFDLAVANNELVTPPAGAVGRGDAFVLSIANKAKAGILSNDSFQEFHGLYDWLFEPGRLIGGKPVPHVGWVFVERTPVRGPKSRQSVKDAKVVADGGVPTGGRRRRGGGGGGGTSSGSPLANEPMPVPTAPPPGPARSVVPQAPEEVKEQAVAAASTAPAAGRSAPVNELMPFLEFVEQHPVGTSCTAVVESYSSHGAYARAGSVLVYIPLRLMDDPPPRSARSRLKLSEAVTLVVVGYAPERRSVDAALPHMAPAGAAPAPAAVDAPGKPAKATKSTRSRRGAKPAPDTEVAAVVAVDTVAEPVAEPVADAPAAEPAPKRGRRSRATPAAEVPAVEEPTTTAGRRSRRPKAAADATAPAEVAAPAATVAPAAAEPAKPKRTSKKAAAAAPAPTEAPAPVKKVAAKKAPAKKAPAKKAAATKTPAKKAAPKKAASPAEAS